MALKSMKVSNNAAAVVTGAGSGIGKSFAYEIARRGGAVICADIRQDRAEAVADYLSALGTHAVPYACDVGKSEQMEELAQKVC